MCHQSPHINAPPSRNNKGLAEQIIPLKQTSFNDFVFSARCVFSVRPLIIHLQLSSSAGVFSADERFPLTKLSKETN